MIKYSTKIKETKNEINYVNRGLGFESLINITNKYYLFNNVALIYKKPTPIKIVKCSKHYTSYKIDEAYFMEPSTTDYNGIYKGKYIDFEAKETSSTTSFPFKNIHQNQINHLFKVLDHGGISFVLINFCKLQKTYLLESKILKEMMIENKKSINIDSLNKYGYEIKYNFNKPVDYLSIIDKLFFTN